MKRISQLPEPYKSLAEKRREESTDLKAEKFSDDLLNNAFVWSKTPESKMNFDFWSEVFNAKTEQELPPIPEAE